MKKVTHILNIILSLCLIAVSVLMCVEVDFTDFGAATISLVCGITSVIFYTMFLIFGAVIPDRDVYAGAKIRKVGMAAVAANAILNGKYTATSTMDTIVGNTPLHRMWTPIQYVILLLLLGSIMAANFFVDGQILHWLTVVWYVLAVLIIISSSFWFNEYWKEITGKSGWKKLTKQYAITLAIVAVVVAYVVLASEN